MSLQGTQGGATVENDDKCSAGKTHKNENQHHFDNLVDYTLVPLV